MFAGLGWTALAVRYIGTDSTWRLAFTVGIFILLVMAGGVCFLYPSVRNYLNSRYSKDD